VPPNGATASPADMTLGHDVIQAYVVQLEAYQACRDAQADHAPLGTSDERKAIWIEQGNAAVDQAHAIADAFAAQLKIFKGRQGEKR
jgi:3-methyladenine DNA glycosylase Mpg